MREMRSYTWVWTIFVAWKDKVPTPQPVPVVTQGL